MRFGNLGGNKELASNYNTNINGNIIIHFSVKSTLVLGENKAGFPRESNY